MYPLWVPLLALIYAFESDVYGAGGSFLKLSELSDRIGVRRGWFKTFLARGWVTITAAEWTVDAGLLSGDGCRASEGVSYGPREVFGGFCCFPLRSFCFP